jgi:hypothetical protein
MKNDLLNSAFTFGIFLIVVGLIGRFLDWKQANTLFLMGVAFEVFALVIYLYQKNKK